MMSDKSSIEWTDATWNPIRGVKGRWSCAKVSPGCQNCYAEAMNVRFGGPRYVAGADALRLDETVLTAPLRWRRPRRVFVCSMTDLFEERVKDEWIDRIFAVMAMARQHTFQVLTKRAARMADYCGSDETLGRYVRLLAELTDGIEKVTVSYTNKDDHLRGLQLNNVWLGVSVEDQARAAERILLLLQTPAAVRFVSAEPLLGPVKLHRYFNTCENESCPHTLYDCAEGDNLIDWVIVGGESGPGARPCDLAWIRSIRDQCRAAGVACFVKQLGASPLYEKEVGTAKGGCHVPLRLHNRKGGDPQEWPEDLRVREFPARINSAPEVSA